MKKAIKQLLEKKKSVKEFAILKFPCYWATILLSYSPMMPLASGGVFLDSTCPVGQLLCSTAVATVTKNASDSIE